MQNKTESSPKRARKVLTGVVVSDKMDKTIVVKISSFASHPVYKKTMKRHMSLKAHDEKNQAKQGDIVKVSETRPISKDKRWRLIEVLK